VIKIKYVTLYLLDKTTLGNTNLRDVELIKKKFINAIPKKGNLTI